MTYVIDPEMADLIDEACDIVEQYGRGMVVNMLVEEARETAETIRGAEVGGEFETDTPGLESAQMTLRLASRVASTQTDDSMDERQFKRKADVFGSAVWGSSPKIEPTEIVVK